METINHLSSNDLALLERVVQIQIVEGRSILPMIRPEFIEEQSRFIDQLTSLRNLKRKIKFTWNYYPTS